MKAARALLWLQICDLRRTRPSSAVQSLGPLALGPRAVLDVYLWGSNEAQIDAIASVRSSLWTFCLRLRKAAFGPVKTRE